MTDSTIITKRLLSNFGACAEARAAITKLNMWGEPVNKILDALDKEGIEDARGWWEFQKQINPEEFVRLNGSVLTMNEKFKLYNPYSGQYEEFTDIEVARNRMIEIATQVFQNHSPRIMTELSNEHGDAVWIDTDEHLKLQAIISS